MNHSTSLPSDSRTLPSDSRRVGVVGGGVVGLTVGVHLARRGHDVTVLEASGSVRGAAAGRTSWSAAGILPATHSATATDPIERLRAVSDEAMGTWCRWLHEQTGIDPGHRRGGGLYLADGPGEAASMAAQAMDWNDAGIVCEALIAEQLRDRFELLRHWATEAAPSRPVAWWVPDESQVRPPRLLTALAAAMRLLGTIQTHAAVHGVEPTDDGVQVDWSDQSSQFDAVVLCGGAGLGRIEPSLQLTESIVPIRGQMLLMRVPGGVPLARTTTVVNLGNRYVVPRGDGHVLVGSCEEEAGWDESTTPAVLEGLQRFAASLFPELNDETILDRWAGLRPMTFDGFPMIGPVPRQQGVFVAGGHHRSGVHLSVATAMLIAEMIEGHPSSIDPTPFAVAKQQFDQRANQ